MRRKTTKQFISEAIRVHGKKYDYSDAKYINTNTKVKISCHKHGIFEQTPKMHIRGQGCARCFGNKKGTTQLFIAKAKSVHGNDYDYSCVAYKNNDTPVEIICTKHGSFFQTPRNHTVQKSKCPYCTGHPKLTTEEFIERALKIHDGRYIYQKVFYVNATTHVTVICPMHGEWQVTPTSHIHMASGCPTCSKSKGEMEIEKFLLKHNMEYISQYSPKQLRGIRHKRSFPRFDFYLPHQRTLIEFDGVQHQKFQRRFHRTYADFVDLKARDTMKDEYARDNQIKLLRIPYKDIKNIDAILSEYLF